MGYYSDPTASAAVGSVDREFARLEKKARRIRDRFEEGKLSLDELEVAAAQFRGIYSHVLMNVFREPRKKEVR